MMCRGCRVCQWGRRLVKLFERFCYASVLLGLVYTVLDFQGPPPGMVVGTAAATFAIAVTVAVIGFFLGLNVLLIWLALVAVPIPVFLAIWLSYDGIRRLGTLDVPCLWFVLLPLQLIYGIIAFGGSVLAAIVNAHVYVQLVGPPESREAG